MVRGNRESHLEMDFAFSHTHNVEWSIFQRSKPLRVFFFVLAGLLLIGSIFGLTAIASDIQLILVAVLFTGALNCLGFGLLLKMK